MMWFFHPLSIWAFGSHVGPVPDTFLGRYVRQEAGAASDMLRANTGAVSGMLRATTSPKGDMLR